MSYRHDRRSKEEFEKEIKEYTLEERSLFFMWLDLVEKETGKRPEYKDAGCGNHGELLEDNEVSTHPDFEVNGYGLVEVKFSKPMLDNVFHLKENQVRSYIKKNATILMVNGINSDIPEYTMLKPSALKDIVDSCDVVKWWGFGNKKAFRIPIKKYIWWPLK